MNHHTPGPWARNKMSGGRVGTLIVQADDSGNSFYPYVASVNYGGSIKTTNANADLIAAAPDLLATLEDIIEQAEKTMLLLGADLADSIMVLGKEAVAKARGGQQ